MCRQLNCPGATGEACLHTVRRCLLCDRGNHFTGYNKCSVVAVTNPAPHTIPAKAATPIRANDTSKTGVSDRSRNRVRRQNKGRPGTPLGEKMVEKEISGAGIMEVLEIDHKERAEHNAGIALPPPPRKKKNNGKGHRVSEYEDNSSSSNAAIPTDQSSSNCARTIQTVDDKKDSGFRLGITVPAPAPALQVRSILKRSASDSELTSHVAV